MCFLWVQVACGVDDCPVGGGGDLECCCGFGLRLAGGDEMKEKKEKKKVQR